MTQRHDAAAPVEIDGEPYGRPGWRFTVTPGGFDIQAGPGEHLTATALRRLPYDQIVRAAAAAQVSDTAEALVPGAGPRPYGGAAEPLQAVAAVYREAVAANLPPRQVIARRWHKSEATAGRWISEARKAGTLPLYRAD